MLLKNIEEEGILENHSDDSKLFLFEWINRKLYKEKRDQDRNDNPDTTILEILAPLPNKNIKEFEDFFDRPPNEKET